VHLFTPRESIAVTTIASTFLELPITTWYNRKRLTSSQNCAVTVLCRHYKLCCDDHWWPWAMHRHFKV